MARDVLIALLPIAAGLGLAYVVWRSSRWLDDVDQLAAE